MASLGGTKPLEEGVLLRYQARDYVYPCFPFPLFQEGCPRSLFGLLLPIRYKGLVIVTGTIQEGVVSATSGSGVSAVR
jgi:hypothetical protein